WDKYGVRCDVTPYTADFPCADIHVLMAPDLLHQIIKGTFKDHLVSWVTDYIKQKHPKQKAMRIIHDIDRRISAVPIFPGLRRFKDGRDFAQWTGDDSKALLKVYIPTIKDHVPDEMVQGLVSFADMCYIFRRNAISSSALKRAETCLQAFHKLREVFVREGIRKHCSLPRQHALVHFVNSIQLFGAPNGLCSLITESKHIVAVKEPWRRTNPYKALPQMLTILVRMDNMQALEKDFACKGMLDGSVAAYTAAALDSNGVAPQHVGIDEDNVGPELGQRIAASIECAETKGKHLSNQR
ncbi:hypothetical protein FA15DRAFT_605075, partial [Coprinopsis marcescibilis]